MKAVREIMASIKEAGLIYHPFITAAILNYEGGFIARSAFYAAHAGASPSEEIYRQAHLDNLRIELGDLITQARLLTELYGWTWQDVIDIGEAKLQDRIDDYKSRGVRPGDNLLNSFIAMMSLHAPPPPPTPGSRLTTGRRPVEREGD